MESPLEEAFDLWWEVVRRHICHQIYALPQINVTAQGRPYRLDFQIYIGGFVADLAREHAIEQSRIAVELDGYEFHERTPAQVAARNQRDRDLQMDDWTVFHFSGSEFHRDPAACITTVLSFALQAFYDLQSAVYQHLDHPVRPPQGRGHEAVPPPAADRG
jgi:very-short-patch-repair endonuclease